MALLESLQEGKILPRYEEHTCVLLVRWSKDSNELCYLVFLFFCWYSALLSGICRIARLYTQQQAPSYIKSNTYFDKSSRSNFFTDRGKLRKTPIRVKYFIIKANTLQITLNNILHYRYFHIVSKKSSPLRISRPIWINFEL